MKLTRRALLSGVSVLALLGPADAALFRTGKASSGPPPSGLPTTMTLVNTSGSTQSANFVTPVFGHSFRKGDIPAKAVYSAHITSGNLIIDSLTSGTIAIGDLVFAGLSAVAPWTYITAGSGSSWTVSPSQTVSGPITMWSPGTPKFTISGTAQSLTWGCQNFWSDHSLKHASFAFRCGSSIAGNGTLTVTVNSGGTTPVTSTRTLTDVYNQSLQVNMAGVVGLSGTYTGVVASNGLNVEQFVYMDGAAGKWWRIRTDAAKSGTAHGQITVYHYIAALTNSSGTLGGFRYVPRISQPWYNVNSPALNTYAANLSWQYGGGPTTQSWNWPFSATDFSPTQSWTGTASFGSWSGTITTVGGNTTAMVTSTTSGQLAVGAAIQGVPGLGTDTGHTIASFGTYTTGSGVGTIILNAQAGLNNTAVAATANMMNVATVITGGPKITIGSPITATGVPAATYVLSWSYDYIGNDGIGIVNLTQAVSTTGVESASAYGAICTVNSSGTHNFWQGQLEGNNGVPGVMSATGGTLDSAFSTGTIYWAMNLNASNIPPNNTQFQIYATSGEVGTSNGSPIALHADGTGTQIFTPVPHILPLQSIFDLYNDGQPKSFLGTGSGLPSFTDGTPDTTIMTQFSCAYLVSTGLINPFDTSFTGETGPNGTTPGTILDNNNAAIPSPGPGPSWNFNWSPITTGAVGLSSLGQGGRHDYIAPLNQYTSRHFYNQSAFSATLMRMQATAADFFGYCSFRDSVTGNYANVSGSSYTGLPATGLEGTLYSEGVNLTLPGGITMPPDYTWWFNIGERNGAHKPSMAFWAALVFADPHFIDLTVEVGIGTIINNAVGLRNLVSPMPAGTGIVSFLNAGGSRAVTWELRDVLHGAIIAPNTHPDGSQSCDMMRDYANNNLSYQWTCCTSALLGSYFYGIGRFNPFSVPANQASPKFDNSIFGFQGGYMTTIIPLGVSALENADTLSLLNFMAQGWQHYLNTFGGFWLYPEDDFAVFLDGAGNSLAPIPNDSYWSIPIGNFYTSGVVTSWQNTSSPYFTLAAGAAPSWPGPANGDLWMWDGSGEALPMTAGGPMSAQTPYYVRDQSGLNFNLATSPGGTAIVITDTGSVASETGSGGGGAGPYTMSINPSIAWQLATTGNTPGPISNYDDYAEVKHAGWCFSNAAGATGYNTVGSAGYSLITDAATRIANGQSVPFTKGPSYLFKDTLI